MRVARESRSVDDGYRSELAPGLRASSDAALLAQEIGFACGRLQALHDEPPDFYAEIRAQSDLEQATWSSFLAVYLSPLQGDEPFRTIRQVLADAGDWHSAKQIDLSQLQLGPRTSHEPPRGTQTLEAYRRMAHNAGSQQSAFSGEPSWSPQRRFQRIFERLALPGFGRSGRYELLVTLGELGLYELRAEELYLISAGRSDDDQTALGAKRIFGIGDAANLERRVLGLAQEIGIAVGALDLALANWATGERATLGFAPDTCDPDALRSAEMALGL
jgi:hypothetical protein